MNTGRNGGSATGGKPVQTRMLGSLSTEHGSYFIPPDFLVQAVP